MDQGLVTTELEGYESLSCQRDEKFSNKGYRRCKHSHGEVKTLPFFFSFLPFSSADNCISTLRWARSVKNTWKKNTTGYDESDDYTEFPNSLKDEFLY